MTSRQRGPSGAVPTLTPPLHHLARDDDALDFAGPFVEAEDADVAVEALDAVVGDVTGAAEDLHGAIGGAEEAGESGVR